MAVSVTHYISIHAAQEGCDGVSIKPCLPYYKFQSTQPKRAATLTAENVFARIKFQSTQPKRAATLITLDAVNKAMISIHAAQEGCDDPEAHALFNDERISIHAAQEGCDFTIPGRLLGLNISIHAAQEGCD